MKKDWRKNIVDFINEYRRLLNTLPETDPRTQEYAMLLRNIECLTGIHDLTEQVFEETTGSDCEA